jgi:hypothetical protein
VVHEHKRLGRGLDLAALAEQLRAAGIGLEFLSGELQGSISACATSPAGSSSPAARRRVVIPRPRGGRPGTPGARRLLRWNGIQRYHVLKTAMSGCA